MKQKSKKDQSPNRKKEASRLIRKITEDMSKEERDELYGTTGECFARLLEGHFKKYGFKIKITPQESCLPTVRAGLHAEMQKFGRQPDPRQRDLFDSLKDGDVIKEAKEQSIEVIGMDLTHAQNQALFAVQNLMSKTGYKGNLPPELVKSKRFKYNGLIPLLEFTPAEYLEAYGVRKHETRRGFKEFGAEARRAALRALVDLAKKQFLLVYKRTYWVEINEKKEREERIDRIEAMDTILQIIRGWEALTKYEDRLLDQGNSNDATDEKLKAIAIKPAPILIQDIEGYYVLKPANYLQEIKMLDPLRLKYSKYFPRFIDYLVAQAELLRRNNEPLIKKIGFKELAYKLRMDSYIKNRMWLRIRQSLNKCYRQAKELGYLLEYETIQGRTKEVERLVLNPEKFEQIRKAEKEREKLTFQASPMASK